MSKTAIIVFAIFLLGCVGAVADQFYSAPGVQPADLAAVAAIVPAPCGTVPSADTLNGTVGTGTCYTRPSDTRPTVVQAAIVATDATGAWIVTWAKPFTSAAPYINPQAINTGGTQPYICNVSSSTASMATGKCWQTITSTLPSVATSLLGLAVNPTGAAASIQVRVAARDTTQ